MTCQLQVAYYRTNKNYCYSELLTWTIQDSTQLLSLQPPLFLYKRFKKNYNWRSSRQIHVLNLKRETKGLPYRKQLSRGEHSQTQYQHVSKSYKYTCNIKLTSLSIHTIIHSKEYQLKINKLFII